MPLFQKNGKTVLFVHIPKTGGTSIEDLLSSYTDMIFYSRIVPSNLKVCPQHLPFRDLRLLLGSGYWDWSFSIVRNPYDKLESEFCFRNDVGDHRYGQQIDFSTWIIESLTRVAENPCFWDNHFRPQTDFLDSDVTIFKYEDGLDDVISEAAQILDVEITQTLESKNSSKRQNISWSLDALTLVNSFYSNDFEQLGYKKRNKKLSFFSQLKGDSS
jgi:hypothetical protein